MKKRNDAGFDRHAVLQASDMDIVGTCFAIRLTEGCSNGCVELYVEDDENYHFKVCFDVLWLTDLIEVASAACISTAKSSKMSEASFEYEMPKYSDPGRILVRVWRAVDTIYRYEYEVLAHDEQSSVMYIKDGAGFEWFFDNTCDFEGMCSGDVFVLENITGEYYCGQLWGEDDDEEWDIGFIRRATEEEIRTETLE